jgi:hypothetical protein
MIRTPVCDLLQIEHPIALGGMGSVYGPALTAAVSNARSYSGAMPFSANSFFAFSFLAKCVSPMPRSTLGALVN